MLAVTSVFAVFYVFVYGIFEHLFQYFSATEIKLSGFLSSCLSLLSFPFLKSDVLCFFPSFTEPYLFLPSFQKIIFYHPWLKKLGEGNYVQRIFSKPILSFPIFLSLFWFLLLISISAANFVSCKITVHIFNEDRRKGIINIVTLSRFLLRNRPTVLGFVFVFYLLICFY